VRQTGWCPGNHFLSWFEPAAGVLLMLVALAELLADRSIRPCRPGLYQRSGGALHLGIFPVHTDTDFLTALYAGGSRMSLVGSSDYSAMTTAFRVV